MTIRETIAEEITRALRAHDELRVSVLRMLSSAIHNREIEKRAHAKSEPGLSDEEVTGAIRSELKKRIDAIAAYEEGKRPEAARRERNEAEILKAFLPAELPDEELVRIVAGALQKTDRALPQDFGKVMGLVMREVGGRASGDRVSAIVKRELAA